MTGSKTGPKRTAIQRERDLVEIARLYLHGSSQMEIADQLGISQPQVSRDLKVLQERWTKSALVDLNEAKAHELARIDSLEREAWDAWRESRGERLETDTEQVSASGGTSGTGPVAGGKAGAVDRKRVRVRKVKLQGNVDFLGVIQWCIEMRCKILGIWQPGRGANPMALIDYSRMTDAQLERIAAGEDPLRVLISGNRRHDAEEDGASATGVGRHGGGIGPGAS